jgi:hypothetical protein
MSKPKMHETPLSEAPWELASEELRELADARQKLRARRLKTPSSSDPIVAFRSVGEQMLREMEVLKRKIEPHRQMQAHAALLIFEGHAEARGIRTKPTPTERVTAIPRQLFGDPAKIGWATNTVAVAGLRFEAVVVRFAARRTQARRYYEPTGQPPGPRSQSGNIEKTIRDMIAAGRDPRSLKGISAAYQIREFAKSAGTDVSKGWSNSVIYRVLSRGSF